MDIVEKGIRCHVMLEHEAPERRALAIEIVLLNGLCRDPINAEELCDEAAHAQVDLAEQPAARLIKRVVEIEDPGFDVGKTAHRHQRLPLSAVGAERAIRVPMPCGVM